jgi:hypothetical protein
VDAYQHFVPSNPGARKVHDGHAAESCCFTASAEGRQAKAFAEELANTADAAIPPETHQQSQAKLTLQRAGFISMLTTVDNKSSHLTFQPQRISDAFLGHSEAALMEPDAGRCPLNRVVTMGWLSACGQSINCSVLRGSVQQE